MADETTPPHFEMGQRIRTGRERLGLTVPQFAEKIDRSINHTYVIEQGKKKPGPRTRARIAAVLGRTEHFLLTGEEPRPARKTRKKAST